MKRFSLKHNLSVLREKEVIPHNTTPVNTAHEFKIKWVLNQWLFGVMVKLDIPEGKYDQIKYIVSKEKESPLKRGNRIIYKTIKSDTLFFTAKHCENFTNSTLSHVYVKVQAFKNSELLATSTKKISKKDNYKLGTHEFKIRFSDDSFQPEILAFYKQLWVEVKPIMKEVLGDAALPSIIDVVKANRYLFNYKKMLIEFKDKERPLTFVHELVHAHLKWILLSRNKNGYFCDDLEVFEEALAQSASAYILNIWSKRYDKDLSFASTTNADYDFRNVPTLVSTDVQSDQNGMGMSWERYQMVEEAFRKIAYEYHKLHSDRHFYKDFLQKYYAFLTADPRAVINREHIVSFITDLVPMVEGQEVRLWLDQQHVLAARTVKGDKLWVNHNPMWSKNEYLSFNDVYLYQTYPNASDWFYRDKKKNEFRYNKNGAEGTIRIYNWNNKEIYHDSFVTTPKESYPTCRGYGKLRLNVSNASGIENSPVLQRVRDQYLEVGNKDMLALFTGDTGLYRIEIELGGLTLSFYRIWGSIMTDYANGLIIAFPNHKGLVRLSFDENNEVFENVPIQAGIAFVQPDCFGKDKELQVRIDVTTKQGTQTYYRNLGFGGKRGGHQLLVM